MADEQQENVGTENGEQQEATTAESQNTETTQAESGTPGPIPYERFKDVNTKLTTAQKQLEKLQAKEKERELEQLSEVDRLKAEKDDLAQQLAEAHGAIKQSAMRDAFRQTASKLKMRFVDGAESDAFALANLDGVEADESGAIQGMDRALKTLAKEKSYLFAQPKAQETDGSAGTGSGTKPVDKSQKEPELKQRFGIR